MELEVYLYFRGNCRQAMEFYKSIFGGQLTLNTYGEQGEARENKDWIIHSELSGGDIKLMASDGSGASDKSAKTELSLTGKDETKMRQVFEKLSRAAKYICRWKSKCGVTFTVAGPISSAFSGR